MFPGIPRSGGLLRFGVHVVGDIICRDRKNRAPMLRNSNCPIRLAEPIREYGNTYLLGSSSEEFENTSLEKSPDVVISLTAGTGNVDWGPMTDGSALGFDDGLIGMLGITEGGGTETEFCRGLKSSVKGVV